MPDKFRIYLNSENAIDGSSSPADCSFNIGSVYENAPALQRYAEMPYCYVKVSYFSILKTPASFSSDNISTLLVKINCPQPNSIESKTLGAGYNKNITTSNILGVIPTGNTNSSYSNDQYDNSYTCISNIFKGDINITLCDQASDRLPSSKITSSNDWEMLLEIYFEDDMKIY
jgi:hypothetical protein